MLELVYHAEFKKSNDFKKLYLQMQDNLIEYRFFTLAGMNIQKWFNTYAYTENLVKYLKSNKKV